MYDAGMTEVVGSITFPQMEQKIGTPGSAGRLVPGNIARVVRPDGSLANLGEVGQLVIAGPAMALGYLHNDEAYVKRLMVVALKLIVRDIRTKQTFVNGCVSRIS